MARKRYAVVGTGGRGIGMFAVPAARDYPAAAELVGLCDINAKRVEYARERAEKREKGTGTFSTS